MFISERIQAAIHALEVGVVSRWIKIMAVVLALGGLVELYDLMSYRGFNSPEAMDAAQVARHLASGQGYSTDFIRPLSLYLVSKHNLQREPAGTNAARLYGPHPDLANPPVYPTLLAGLMKVSHPKWSIEMHKSFWSEGGRYLRYQPEFLITLFNQALLFAAVGLTFLLARALLDPLAAWLAALLTLGSETLWKFSVSGQSTLLLLVIFLGLLWCLMRIEQRARAGLPDHRRIFMLATLAGALIGLGLLTRYAFGWVLVPTAIFLVLFGGARRTGLAVAAGLAFIVVAAPWLIRNLVVSGTLFGTAGYAVVENTFPFPGFQLMQSLDPDMAPAFWVTPYLRKLIENSRAILQSDLLRLGNGWMGMLFFAGLLLGLRNLAARRMRYFALMCLGWLVVVQALGRTYLSTLSPELNSENLLVLLTPLVMIFGAAFFLTLLEQMNLPSLQWRFLVIGVLVAMVCQPLLGALLPPKTSPVAYPPYYPPDIQKIAGWMQPEELLMSDIPWSVAWYGQRQCSWTTRNSQYDFVALNDYIKPVKGLYLSLATLDGKLISECKMGGADSWGNFAFQAAAYNQLPKNFPLRNFPAESLPSGLFLTDRQRW